MSRKFKKPCAFPGCPHLTFEKYCSEHKRTVGKAMDARRPSSYARGYTAEWQKARREYLKEYPLCRHCEQRGRLEAAVLIDHIIPHKGDMDLFWDHNNWQPLCQECHNRKTMNESIAKRVKPNKKREDKKNNEL